MVNKNCDSCDSCDYCYSCYYCDYCDSCNSCDSCDYCDYCDGCYKCENLVNGFRCVGVKLSKKDPNRYWIFNKEVTKKEWGNRYNLGFKEKVEVCSKCGQEINNG